MLLVSDTVQSTAPFAERHPKFDRRVDSSPVSAYLCMPLTWNGEVFVCPCLAQSPHDYPVPSVSWSPLFFFCGQMVCVDGSLSDSLVQTRGGWSARMRRVVGSKDRQTTPHNHQHNPQYANYWAPLTRKRHHKAHRPQRPSERSAPTQWENVNVQGPVQKQQPDGMSHRGARSLVGLGWSTSNASCGGSGGLRVALVTELINAGLPLPCWCPAHGPSSCLILCDRKVPAVL